MTRVVKCVKSAQGLEVGKLYEVSCDNYELIHVVNGDGYSRDHFEYVTPPTEPVVPPRRTRTFAKDRTPRYMLKSQVGGTHYSDLKIQPFAFIRKFRLDFFEGNVIKYLSRYERKNGNEDLDKAIGYVREVWKDRQSRIPLFSSRKYCDVNGFPQLYDVFYEFVYGGMESCIAKIEELKSPDESV